MLLLAAKMVDLQVWCHNSAMGALPSPNSSLERHQIMEAADASASPLFPPPPRSMLAQHALRCIMNNNLICTIMHCVGWLQLPELPCIIIIPLAHAACLGSPTWGQTRSLLPCSVTALHTHHALHTRPAPHIKRNLPQLPCSPHQTRPSATTTGSTHARHC